MGNLQIVIKRGKKITNYKLIKKKNMKYKGCNRCGYINRYSDIDVEMSYIEGDHGYEEGQIYIICQRCGNKIIG